MGGVYIEWKGLTVQSHDCELEAKYGKMETAAGTSSGSGSGNDVVTWILTGLEVMQNELKSVHQEQDKTAQMVRESQMESARILAKGKKPAFTFRKGNEIQSAFIDKVTDQVTSAAAQMKGVEAADDIGAAKLAKAKEDLLNFSPAGRN